MLRDTSKGVVLMKNFVELQAVPSRLSTRSSDVESFLHSCTVYMADILERPLHEVYKLKLNLKLQTYYIQYCNLYEKHILSLVSVFNCRVYYSMYIGRHTFSQSHGTTVHTETIRLVYHTVH